MANMDNTNQKLELLKMARQLLNEEYINRRAEDHNAWLAKCDEAWRTRRVKLPYPPFAPYPTEEQIVAKALTLYNFINPNEGKNTTDTNEQPKLSEQEINIANQVKNKPEMPKVVNTPWALYYDNPIDQLKEPQIPPAIDPVIMQETPTNVEEMFKPKLVEEPETKNDVVSEKYKDEPSEKSTTPSSINATMKSLLPNFWKS